MSLLDNDKRIMDEYEPRPYDMNRDDEIRYAIHKYMAAPGEWYRKFIKRKLNKEDKVDNKGIAGLAVVGIIALVAVGVAAVQHGALDVAKHAIGL